MAPSSAVAYSQSAGICILGKHTLAIPEGAAGLGFIRDQAMNLQLLSMRYEMPKKIWDFGELAFVDP